MNLYEPCRQWRPGGGAAFGWKFLLLPPPINLDTSSGKKIEGEATSARMNNVGKTLKQ